ncbi:MAG TPA: hypothetical protein VNZ52_05825 [Candidatus Thermoplasmatota archaeon]|nr:hypothetical protein [Candidatus Thermoplasmatota archaeon]
MARLLALVIALATLLTGCLADVDGSKSAPRTCGLSVHPASGEANATAPNLNNTFLEAHPTLRAQFEKPGLSGGVGATVSCEEGEQTLEALTALGAPGRDYPGQGGERVIQYANATYRVTVEGPPRG